MQKSQFQSIYVDPTVLHDEVDLVFVTTQDVQIFRATHEPRHQRHRCLSVYAAVLLVCSAYLTGCANSVAIGGSLATWTGNASPGDGHPDTLRVATINMGGVVILGLDFPPWRQNDARFKGVTEHLRRNTPDIDVVLLQEMWKGSARRRLLADPGLARAFPYRIDAVDDVGGNGLVALSRYPIVGNQVRFHRFDRNGFWWALWQADFYGRKGVFGFQIELPSGYYWIMNTHLVACYKGDQRNCEEDMNAKFRFDQVLAVQAYAASLTGTAPAIIGGDFNITRSSRYHALMRGAGGRSDHRRDGDFADSLTRHGRDRSWHDTPEAAPPPSGRLDYLWVRPGDDYAWRVVEPTREIFPTVDLPSGKSLPLSDHEAMLGGFCLVSLTSPTSCLHL